MNKIKSLWSNIFGISASEYSGFRILVFTSLICVIGLTLANSLTKSPYDNYEQDARTLDSLLLIMDEREVKEHILLSRAIILEQFDPNTASIDKLEKLGFPTWLANRLVNYRLTGARFKKPTDLQKLYGFPDSLYTQVADYIYIKPLPSLKPIKSKNGKKIHRKDVYMEPERLPVFNLNTADTSVLKTIKGIGSKLSSRIVAYRNSLGGYISKSQLYQVYGLDSLVIESLVDASTITSDFEPLKVDINTLDKNQLASHPYINWREAKLIIAYRNQHGPFGTKQDLLKVYSINENWLKKIAPYLTF